MARDFVDKAAEPLRQPGGAIGRTARMNRDGTAYVLQWENEPLPDFVESSGIEVLREAPPPPESNWKTVYLSGGRRDKISKGDIVGLFLKQGQLQMDQLGMIELKQDCAFVAVQGAKAKALAALLDNRKLKKRKVRVKVI